MRPSRPREGKIFTGMRIYDLENKRDVTPNRVGFSFVSAPAPFGKPDARRSRSTLNFALDSERLSVSWRISDVHSTNDQGGYFLAGGKASLLKKRVGLL